MLREWKEQVFHTSLSSLNFMYEWIYKLAAIDILLRLGLVSSGYCREFHSTCTGLDQKDLGGEI